jgi:hypothetical protein
MYYLMNIKQAELLISTHPQTSSLSLSLSLTLMLPPQGAACNVTQLDGWSVGCAIDV